MFRAAPKNRFGLCNAFASTPPDRTFPEAGDTVLYALDGVGDKFVNWEADLSMIYGELTKGNYRLVKTIFADADNYINGKHYAFFEFEIE